MGINNQSKIKLSSPFKRSNISTTSNLTNASNSTKTSLVQTWKYMFFFTLLMIIIILFFMFRTKTSHVDPSLYMNDDLTEAQKIQVQIHSQHHSIEDIEQLVELLKQGKEWDDAHTVLKPLPWYYHISHVDTEIIYLLIRSLSVTVGLIFAFLLQSIIEKFSPSNGNYRIWYYSLCFFFITLIFSISIMYMKHILSFRTYNKDLFY